MICEWNLLFWRLDLAYFKNDLSFDDLAGPVKKMAIPQHGFGPQNKLTKLCNYGHNSIKTVYTSRLKQQQSSHSYHQISDIYSDIFKRLSFSSTSFFPITVVSGFPNLHKPHEALACYYVTSHWQAEWIKKRRWKTIESPSPTPLVLLHF